MRPPVALLALLLTITTLMDRTPARAQPAAAPPPAPPFAVEQFTLPNGLRVWLQPRADSQSIAAMLVFRAGARYEAREQSGVSHFVEHMLFTGTERWAEDEIKTAIQKRGGRWNGWTGYERTTYFAQVAAADAPAALDWLAEIAFRSTFPADKIDKERQVVFQEKSGRYGWVVNTLDQLGFGYELGRDVRRALYPGSTLGQRIIGEDDSLDALGRDELLAYYRSHYTPANATLVIVGRVDAAQVRTLVGEYFGNLPPGERPADPAPPPATPPGPHRVTVRGPALTDQVTLMLGARTVGRGHPDRYALDVLGELLRTELTEEIRYRRGLVYGLWASNTSFDDTGYFAIETTSAGEHADEIRRLVRERLERLRAGEVDPGRVAEAQNALAGRWALSMEDNVGRATYLAEWTSALAPGATLPDYGALVHGVTPEDLVRVANSYLVPEASFEGAHTPAITVADGAPWLAGIAAAGALGWGLWRWRRKALSPVGGREGR